MATPDRRLSYAEQVAISVYEQLSDEDRIAIAGGEFPLAAFSRAHERYRMDQYPARPKPEWDREFMRALRDIAVEDDKFPQQKRNP